MSWCRIEKFFRWRGWLGKGLWLAVLMALLSLGSFDELDVLPVDLVLLPYQYSVVNWELSNLPDKLVRNLVNLWPGQADLARGEVIEQAQDYFNFGLEIRGLERRLFFPEASFAVGGESGVGAQSLASEVLVIENRRNGLRAAAEEIIESEIALIVEEEGLSSWFGVFPPVDVVLSRSPHILIFSPRDRIERQRDVLLNPGLGSVEKDLIEDRISELGSWSIYIADSGGVSFYPSVVSDVFGLRNAVEITAHEWLHQWLLFRSLGRNYWSSPDMTVLNETVATVAGRELGDLAYESLIGEEISAVAGLSGSVAVDVNGFDFREEMQQTRLHAEELLAEGKIEQAEVYMEARRKLFVDHGFLIRKLNQAYFAFHGTYATSPASISPIGDQVQKVRDRSSSLQEFLNTMSGFGSYPEFVEYLGGLRDG